MCIYVRLRLLFWHNLHSRGTVTPTNFAPIQEVDVFELLKLYGFLCFASPARDSSGFGVGGRKHFSAPLVERIVEAAVGKEGNLVLETASM